MVKRESIRSPFKRQTVDNYRRKLQYLVFGNRRCPRNGLLALVPYFPELECFAGVLKHGENKVGRDEVFWWRSLCSRKRNSKAAKGKKGNLSGAQISFNLLVQLDSSLSYSRNWR